MTHALPLRWRNRQDGLSPCLGRAILIGESIAAASAQTHVPHGSLRHIPPPQVIPPLPTPGIQPHQSQYHAGYIPGERVDGSGQDGTAECPILRALALEIQLACLRAHLVHQVVEMVGDMFRARVIPAEEPDLPAAVAVAHPMRLARLIRIQVACFRLMIALATLRILMMLIVSVVVVALPGLEPGTVCLVLSVAVRIVVVIH